MSKQSSKIVQRVDTPSAPVALNTLLMNSKGSAEKSLFYICVNLRKRLEKVPGLQQYLRIAYITATTTNEEQACALSQNPQRRLSLQNGSTLANGSTLSDLSGERRSDDNGFSAAYYNFYTFASGMLPANVSCDPVTQIWKLFQQGAPLCVIYNSVNPNNQLPIVSADDLKICKRSVYDFLLRCKEDLNLRDDELFPISYVFSSSTNDLLQVIQVVNTVLDLNPNFALNESEKQDLFLQMQGPKDARFNVVRELVETERKYVQDLEIMLAYKNELRQAELIPSESLHTLLPNLNEIVDLQRRLLVGLEANALAPPKLQRIGSIFLHSSEPFKAYEPWSVGQKAAAEIIEKDMANLERSSQLIRGELELNSFLLKPVQRLCKYPLLLKELVKYTDQTWPHYNELVSALQASKETAAHVNEAQRRVENLVQLRELQERVADWKGYDINSFGDLLYHGALGVRDQDTEREFNVYLFEQIMLFFKEAIPKEAQKKSKKKNSLADTSNNKYKLELKGRIYIPNIYNISSNSPATAQGHFLTVSWSGSRDSGSFVMRFRSEETRNQWETCLRDLVHKLREEIQEYKAATAAAAAASAAGISAGHGQMNGFYSPIEPPSRAGSTVGLEHGGYSARFAQSQYSHLKQKPEKMRANSSSYVQTLTNNSSVNGLTTDFDARVRSALTPSIHKNIHSNNNNHNSLGNGNGNMLISPMSNLSLNAAVQLLTPTKNNHQLQ